MNAVNELLKGFGTSSYIKVNLSLATVIVFIFIYSSLFSPEKENYPVECIHEKFTGEPCISCGLSHSFSLIIRGRISEAYDWNPYGMRIFIFFLAQFIMRIAFSFFYIKMKDAGRYLIIYDIAGSVVIFLLAFHPFLAYIFHVT